MAYKTKWKMVFHIKRGQQMGILEMLDFRIL